MLTRVVVILICSFLFEPIHADYFTVVGPRTAKLDEDYKLSVTHKGNKETNIFFQVVKKSNNEDLLKRNETFKNSEKRDVVIELSKNGSIDEDFNIIVTSENFEQSVNIKMITKKCTVLIQTDKAVYKPGDKVQYRILVLNSETKPHQFYEINVNIKDAAGNEVLTKLFDGYEHSDDLVLEDSFNISDDPYVGDWKLSVTVDGDTEATEKVFKVKEYVLPRFEVFIETNEDITTEQDILLKVSAKYNFGEYVEGIAKIKVKVFQSQSEKILKQKRIDKYVAKEEAISFKLKEDLEIYNVQEAMKITVEVVFEENLTDQTIKAEKTITVKPVGKSEIKVNRPKLKFKPGFPYKFTVAVYKSDGVFETQSGDVNVQVDFSFSQICSSENENSIQKSSRYFSNKLMHGKSEFEVDVPKNASAMALNVSFKENVRVINVLRSPSNSWNYIVASISENTKVEVGKPFVLNVESSFKVDEVYGLVVGRTGKTIENKFSMKSTSFSISFLAEAWMVPQANIFVYYIHHTGEVVYDILSIKLEENLSNQLNIGLSKKQVEPQDEVTLFLQSKPSSTVYLLAVDHSVNLLGTGNDIEEKSFFNDLEAFNAYKNFSELEIEGADDDRYLDVGELNTFIITNAYDGKLDCSIGRSSLLFGGFLNSFESGQPDETPNDIFVSKVRTDFPETWIFEKVDVNKNGFVNLTKKLPDTITTWDITGFSMSRNYGLAVAKPQKLLAKQDFFAVVHLPYSIRVGEILKVEVSVFNYLSRYESIDVDVTLYSKSDNQTIETETTDEKSDDIEYEADEELEDSTIKTEFDFYNAVKDIEECEIKKLKSETAEGKMKKTIKVRKGSGSSTFFYIRSDKAGLKNIKVQAEVAKTKNNRIIFDEVHKKLRVINEGVTEYTNFAKLFNLRNNDKDSYNAEIVIDKEPIKNSIKITATVIGDLIGPALADTSKLVRIPTGCYEQRLKKFLPITVTLDYLNATKLITAHHKEEGIKGLIEGFNDIIETRHTDGVNKGAFSIWGRVNNHKIYNQWVVSKDSSSIWLTAYISKCLGKSHWFKFDAKILSDALKFLKSKQNPDGNFTEYGPIHHKELQSDSVSLTAFTLIAFKESSSTQNTGQYDDVISKSLEYINNKAYSIKDNYGLAIVAYALALGGQKEKAGKFLDVLYENAYFDGHANIKYWDNELDATRGSTPASIRNEIAAYVILAYVKIGKAEEAIPIVNWLVSQRNSEGGFSSTHDTVIAIEALAAVATELYSKEMNMQVKFNLVNNEKLIFKIDKQNRLQKQTISLPPSFRSMSLNANGKGIASVQVSYSYKRNVTGIINRDFNLTVTEVPSKSKKLLRLKACAVYKPKSGESESSRSGMTIIEIQLPSGYVADPAFDFYNRSFVKKFEFKEGNSLIVLYFDTIDTHGVCPEVQGIRQRIVDMLKPSPVKVYEYYKKDESTTTYFYPRDVCFIKSTNPQTENRSILGSIKKSLWITLKDLI